MSDETYTDDDRLDARLRVGLTALVAEAPEPPPLSGPTIGSAPRSRRLLAVAAAVVAVGLLVASVVAVTRGPDDTNTVTTPEAARSLLGTTFVLAEASDGGTRIDLPDSGRPWLRLICVSGAATSPSGCGGGLRLVGSTGCRTFDGALRMFEGRPTVRTITFSPTTCQQTSLSDLDEAVGHHVLALGGAGIDATGDEVSSRLNGDELVFRAWRVPDLAELSANRWRLIEARDRLDHSARVPERPPILLSFDENSMQGDDNCNVFEGRVELRGDRLAVDDFMTTKAFCPDELPQLIGRVVSADVVVGRSANKLHLVTTDGAELTYRAVETKREPAADLLEQGDGFRLTWHLRSQSFVSVDVGDRHATVPVSLHDPDAFARGAVVPNESMYVSFGVAPAHTVRVTALVLEGAVDLLLHTLRDSQGLQGFGGLVPEPPDAIVAYDADGHEIGRIDGHG